MLKQKQSIVADYKNALVEKENEKTKNLFNSLPEEKVKIPGMPNLPLGFNSTESESAKAIVESSMDSNMVNNLINYGSYAIKGLAGRALTFLGATNAYGGQQNSNNIMSSNDIKNMMKDDKRIEAIQGMSKKEIGNYDQMELLKSKKPITKPTYF